MLHKLIGLRVLKTRQDPFEAEWFVPFILNSRKKANPISRDINRLINTAEKIGVLWRDSNPQQEKNLASPDITTLYVFKIEMFYLM